MICRTNQLLTRCALLSCVCEESDLQRKLATTRSLCMRWVICRKQNWLAGPEQQLNANFNPALLFFSAFSCLRFQMQCIFALYRQQTRIFKSYLSRILVRVRVPYSLHSKFHHSILGPPNAKPTLPSCFLRHFNPKTKRHCFGGDPFSLQVCSCWMTGVPNHKWSLIRIQSNKAVSTTWHIPHRNHHVLPMHGRRVADTHG